LRTPLTVSAAGAADMMRPAVKKRTMREVVIAESLARRGFGGVVVGRGTVLVGVIRTGVSTSSVEKLVVVLRLRTDKIEGKRAGTRAREGRWLIYLAGQLLSTPCRTDNVVSARVVARRVDGSEVEGADSSLGANIIDCYGRIQCQGG
jgi:hypothetical protein